MALASGSLAQQSGPTEGLDLAGGGAAGRVELHIHHLIAARLDQHRSAVGVLNAQLTLGGVLRVEAVPTEDLNRVRWQDWVESGEKVYGQLKSRCEHVILGGESMGGLVALYLASRHPEVRGVMLYAPAIKLNISTADRIKLYLGSLFMPFAKRESMDASDKWQGYHPELPTKGIVQLLRFQDAVKKVLPQIKQPIIIFQGRKDTTVDPAAGEMILSSVRSNIKEHHWMENSTHPILIDVELDAVTDLSVRFTEKILKAG